MNTHTIWVECPNCGGDAEVEVAEAANGSQADVLHSCRNLQLHHIERMEMDALEKSEEEQP